MRLAFDAHCCKKGSGDKKIKDKYLRSVLTSVGWNPSDKELTEMLAVMDPGGEFV